MRKILLLNGPNLNMLGIREPDKYGNISLSEIVENLKKDALKEDYDLIDFQTNAEEKMIDRIHQAKLIHDIQLIIINPAAWTHTSIAIRDALLSVNINFIEIHLSNVFSREKFRHFSYFSDISIGTIIGFGSYGYSMALKAGINFLKGKQSGY